MGTGFRTLHKLVKFSILMILFILSISVQVLASDDPQPNDDGGNTGTEDTDYARSATPKIQI